MLRSATHFTVSTLQDAGGNQVRKTGQSFLLLLFNIYLFSNLDNYSEFYLPLLVPAEKTTQWVPLML